MTPDEAREHLRTVRDRLRSRTATSAEHRAALEAVLALDEPEAGRWLAEITYGFAYVYGLERAERQRRQLNELFIAEHE